MIDPVRGVVPVNGTALPCELAGDDGPRVLVMHVGPGVDRSCVRSRLDALGGRARLVFVDAVGAWLGRLPRADSGGYTSAHVEPAARRAPSDGVA